MTSQASLDIIKQLSDQVFVTFGGYNEMSKYMTLESHIKALFFPGQTLYMSNLTNNAEDLLSFDLQLYGYSPNTPLNVLSENFNFLYSTVLPPTTVEGKVVYIFGTNQTERNLLYKQHCRRLLFNFSSYGISNTIQVIAITRVSPSIYSSVLNSYRNIKLTNNITQTVDELFIDFTHPSLHLFSCPSSQPFTSLFSPTNQSTHDSQITLSVSSATNFCVCSISYSPYNPLIGLTLSQVISTLSPSYQKIYFDNLSQSHYWLSNDLSNRIVFSFAGSTVYSSTKESITRLPISIIKSTGDTSRLISKNNIYTLKSFKQPHPRLSAFCQA
jgi:hypothetical protein